MIKEEYVSFNVAKLLKKKGFVMPSADTYRLEYHLNGTVLCDKENGKHYSDVGITACTQQLALAWLRENYGLLIYGDISFSKWEGRIKQIHGKNLINNHSFISIGGLNTYEEAVEAALKYTLENLI